LSDTNAILNGFTGSCIGRLTSSTRRGVHARPQRRAGLAGLLAGEFGLSPQLAMGYPIRGFLARAINYIGLT
jgi:hypothetical protein